VKFRDFCEREKTQFYERESFMCFCVRERRRERLLVLFIGRVAINPDEREWTGRRMTRKREDGDVNDAKKHFFTSSFGFDGI
jgi:hypothetical protein